MQIRKQSQSFDSFPIEKRSLPVALMRARDRVISPFRQLLARTGISEQKWRILHALSDHGPQDMRALARRCCLQPPSLTRLVQALEAAGLVLRRIDQDDRRRHVAALSPRGRWIVNRNAEAAQEILESYRTQLGDERYETLLDLLEALEDESPDPDAQST